MEQKKTENVKLIGTLVYSVLLLVSSHLSLRYILIFWLKGKKNRKKRNVFVRHENDS